MDERYQLKGLLEVSDDRGGLGTKLGDGTPARDLGTGRSHATFGGAGVLGHGALRARGVLLLEAERRPQNRVELEDEEQRQNQTHAQC